MRTLGIDIGGSKIEYIVIDFKPFRILDRQRYPTPKNMEEFLSLLKSILSTSYKEYSINSIGIGIPGYVYNNKIKNCPSLPFLRDFDIVKYLKEIKDFSNINIVIDNDANLFAYAESYFGKGKGKNPVVGIIWGTGIGAGIVLERKIYKGFYNSAGEFGHTIVEFNGNKCRCGNRGCLEAYAGGWAIVDKFNRLEKNKNVDNVKDIISQRSKNSRLVIEEALNYMAIGVANLFNILSPEIIVLGGGLSNIKGIEKRLEEKARKYIIKGTDIKIEKNILGDSAGVIGAALLANKII